MRLALSSGIELMPTRGTHGDESPMKRLFARVRGRKVRKDVVNGGSFAEPFAGNKTLVGEEGNDAVQGGLGSDNVLGGEGNDYMVDGEFEPPAVKDTLSGADGNDGLNVANKPAGKDVVSCGSGFDRVLADRADVLVPDCEKVFIGPAAADRFINSIPQSFIEG